MEHTNGVLSCGAAAVVDILDIKWESLVSADKPRLMPPGSALRRFATHRILHDIGVSAAFAGDALLQKLKSVCQQQMDSEASSLTAAAAPGNSPAEWFWSSCVPHCYARVCVCVCVCVRACVFSTTTSLRRPPKGNTSLGFSEARDDGVWDGSGVSCTICKQSAPRS